MHISNIAVKVETRLFLPARMSIYGYIRVLEEKGVEESNTGQCEREEGRLMKEKSQPHAKTGWLKYRVAAPSSDVSSPVWMYSEHHV